MSQTFESQNIYTIMTVYHSVYVQALVGAFNQEKAQVGALTVIVKTSPIDRLQL